jgi:mono/diheme cytochrome c family protein
VADYLKDLGDAQVTARQPIRADDPVMIAGKAIYADRCSACHVVSGAGIPRLFPQLAKASLVNNDDATSLIRVVLAGSRAGGRDVRPTAPAMPANLDDAKIANVLPYVQNNWGTAAPTVTESEVSTLRASMKP